MDVREKLVELIVWIEDQMTRAYPYTTDQFRIETTVDHLIANGVTVQEWIPVTERLPEVGGYVVCIAKRNTFSRFMQMVARIEKNGWVNPITEQYISEVTHWMPIPQPPKGE